MFVKYYLSFYVRFFDNNLLSSVAISTLVHCMGCFITPDAGDVEDMFTHCFFLPCSLLPFFFLCAHVKSYSIANMTLKVDHCNDMSMIQPPQKEAYLSANEKATRKYD